MLRPMRLGDEPGVSDVHLASFPGFFLSFLGRDFLRLYYRGVCRSPKGIAWVYVDEKGKVAGFVAGASDPKGFYASLLSRDWLRFAVASLSAVCRRPSISPRLLRALGHHHVNPPGEQVAGLFSLGVSPGLQGKGVGRALVQKFLEEARLRGARKVFLATDAQGNDPVNAFYAKCGFTAERRYRTSEGRLMNEYWIDVK